VECGLFPLYEAHHGDITEVTPIRHQVPVEDYLKPQKRFAHLFREPVDHEALANIQETADRNIRRFGLVVGAA
jgi:pyruvate ferredoxin oxidoreductase beta subunit